MEQFTASLIGPPGKKQIFEDEEIRDALAHDSTIANMARYKIITVYVASTLDQIISIRVRANETNSTTGATNIGAAFNVAATTGIEARTLTPDTSGWMPYMYIVATCAVAPTSGDLNTYIIGRN